MPTDQLAALDAALPASVRARPAWLGATRRAAGRLLRSWPGRRPTSPLHGALRELDDHMLADIGLTRDARAPRGIRPPDPWFLAQHLR